MNSRSAASKIARLGVMGAISCVLVILVKIPFPPAPFLVYDPADIPIYITTFAYGPGAGLILTFIVSFIQAFPLGGDGLYGFVMHMVATGGFAVIAGTIYGFKKTKRVAVASLVTGVIAVTAVMCAANYFITPYFLGTPKEAVVKMILPVIVPFNLMKTGINSVVTFFIYKRISRLLHR